MINRRNGSASAVRHPCNKEERRLLVALHDVSPVHARRLERAERTLTSLGLSTVTYLFVPDFHGRGESAACHDFRAWCLTTRAFDVEWCLHGFFHREDAGALHHATASDWLGRRFLTNGEAEFLSLRGVPLEARLSAGIHTFADCFGWCPAGFVAPAWLYNDELLPALKRLHFSYTESHFHVFDLVHDRALPSPVVTWASRTSLHRAGSLGVAELARRIWAQSRLVRVALHPGDFDHPRIVDSARRLLDTLLVTHRETTYERACGLG